MVCLRRNILLLTLGCGLLAGCAFDFSSSRQAESGGIRGMIAMDGTRIGVDDPIENGRALLLTGQYGLAVTQLSHVVNDQPQSVRALNLLAEAYGRLHRFDLADRYHAEALALDPSSVVTLNNWGYSYLVRGDKARAVGLLERAAAIKGDQPVVAANLQLAIGPIADTKAVHASLPVAADIGDVLISDHVTMVRRNGKLVRLAPGVQLLVTEATEPVMPAAPHARAADATVAVPYIAARTEERVPDSRTLLFRALFKLMEAPAFEALPDPDLFASTAGVNVTAP